MGIVGIAVVVLAGGGRTPAPLGSGPPPSFAPLASGTVVLLGAGDIAVCDSDADEATARLLDALEGTVFTTGDNVYPSGTSDHFARCYDPTWGRHLERTRFPVAGNHEWDIDEASGYLEYFGTTAQPAATTWSAATVGSWRVIVLDSNCPAVGGCGEGSAQLDWLRGELAANTARCTVALWHHPRFSSGAHGGDDRTASFWRELYANDAELILNGHDHHYERFAPQDPDGVADAGAGIRQIVVGTGGAALRRLGADAPNSESSNVATHGILRLVLGTSGYEWAFVPVAGGTFTDAGAGTCH